MILVCSCHLLKLPNRAFHISYPLSSNSVFNSPPSSCISSSSYSSISVPFIILFCWYCHPTFKILPHLIELFEKNIHNEQKLECSPSILFDYKLKLFFLLYIGKELSSNILLDTDNRFLQIILNTLSIHFLLAYIL